MMDDLQRARISGASEARRLERDKLTRGIEAACRDIAGEFQDAIPPLAHEHLTGSIPEPHRIPIAVLRRLQEALSTFMPKRRQPRTQSCSENRTGVHDAAIVHRRAIQTRPTLGAGPGAGLALGSRGAVFSVEDRVVLKAPLKLDQGTLEQWVENKRFNDGVLGDGNGQP